MHVVTSIIVVAILLSIAIAALVIAVQNNNTINDAKTPQWLVDAASMSTRFLDTVPTGTSANAVPIRIPSTRLTSIKTWFAVPLAGTATIKLRVYRYRRVNGVFSYVQLNDTITLDSSTDWSVIHDWSSTIRNIEINQDTDELAISTVYTLNGASNNIRALQITITTGNPSSNTLYQAPVPPTVSATPLWPL